MEAFDLGFAVEVGGDFEGIAAEERGQARRVVAGIFHRETEADLELVRGLPIEGAAAGDGAAVVGGAFAKGIFDVALVFGEADAGAVADFVVERAVERGLEGGIFGRTVVEQDVALMGGAGDAGFDVDHAAGGVAAVVGALGAGFDGEALDVEEGAGIGGHGAARHVVDHESDRGSGEEDRVGDAAQGDDVAEAAGVAVARAEVGREAGHVLQLRHAVLLEEVLVKDGGGVLDPETVDAEFGFDLEGRHFGRFRVGGGQMAGAKSGENGEGRDEANGPEGEAEQHGGQNGGGGCSGRGFAEAAKTLNPCPKVRGCVQFFRRPAEGLFLRPGRSAAGADRDEFVPRAEKQRAVRNRRRREAGFTEGVFRGDREFVRGRHDVDVTQLAGEENIPAVRHR